MAGIINQYNKTQRSALDKQRVHYKKQIKTLERELAKSAEATTHYRGRSEAKSKELKELQAASDNMAAKITELEIKLDASEMLPNQLNQRIQELEQNFNQAVIEQQDLYVRSKTHCDETIKELQEIVVMKQAAAEKAIQNAEAIRDDMMQRFRQGIAQHKVEALELGHQIETLTQQIEGKDMVLIQQKETIRDLSEKVNDLETSSHSFESLATQNQELLRQIDHHGSQAQKQSEACAKETWNRLASVSNSLDTLAKSLSDQPRVISSIQEVQTRELGSIATKLDAILQTRESAKEVTKQLSTELDTQMGKIWERLDNQIETLSQQLAQKAEENGMLSALCKEKEMTYERLEQDMEELQKASAEQIEKIQALREREQEYHLAMEAAREDDQQHTQELTERLKASEAETSRLTEQLKLKMESMTNLGEQMKVKEEEFGNGLRSFSAEILKLNQVIENKDRAAQDAIARATEMAAREVHVKMEETLAETQQHIRQRDEHIKGLQTQLGELKRSLHDKEQNQRRDACSLSSLRETLSTAQLKEKELSEKLTTQSAKFNELEGQLRSRMDIVNAELEATKRRVIEYEREIEAAKEKAEKFERESRNQRARAQALFSAVKDWAHKGGFETASFDEICGEKKSAEEVGSGLSQALAQLGLSQRVQVNYHRRDDLLLDGNEPHFNNTNRELPVLLSQESYFGNTSEQPQEVLALIHSRRVVVRSPANDRDTPIPPSVSEEKVRRREGAQPKSIMKTTVARVTRSTTLAAQDPNAPEATNGDRMRNSHLNGDLMASSPDPLISNAAETSELYALSPHLPMTGRTQSAGQNKRKQPDDPGPDIFVTRQRKPKTSKMTEDIETETLAQLEELVGAKKRPAKKKVVRTYGTQKPLETFHEDGSASNALQLLHPDSQAQSRLSSQQRQSPGSSKLKESQESSDNSQDSIETVGVHSEVSMEGGGSSTRLPPLRRNARK
ncbi:hypothetical protein QBC38DRAFT_386700 [Podospora fimiseda]|uniref:Uncharacterized protein n=1 Tax=Podospora fimiseda TaxID=252190 RepID=A0AAN7H1Q2_9PEZI|nr:hypothetical protein QBC38DRAFT_386700 [Podospora fimiseda]